MSTDIARKALQENLDRHISRKTDQIQFNLHVALFQMTNALDDISQRIANLERKISRG